MMQKRLLFIIFFPLLLVSCKKVPPFRIDAVNYSPQGRGVIVTDVQGEGGNIWFISKPQGEKGTRYLGVPKFEYHEQLELDDPAVSSTGVETDVAVVGHDSMPEYLTVTWKLAKLTNCETVFKHYTSGCEFKVVDNTMYSKRLALRAPVLAEYEKMGKYSEGNIFSLHYAQIFLVFKDEELELDIRWNRTNPFI